jgi:CRISPR-associated endonuclease/helicase Cas3
MLQRLGRLNRDGHANDEALALFFELSGASKSRGRPAQAAGPYEPKDVADGRKLVARLVEISAENPAASFREMYTRLASEPEFASLLETALRPKPEPFPRAIDVHGLFTNEPDAFGGFTDISRFVRGGDRNADATIFWRDWKPDTDSLSDIDGPAFSRDEGCLVAIHRVREFLGEKGRAWLWNSSTEQWESARADDLVPGMLIMLPVSAGGYDRRLGWTGRKTDTAGLEDAPPPGLPEERTTDDQAIGCWVDLQTHLNDVEKEAESVIEVFPSESPFRKAILHSARYHDIGKSIPQWQQQALPQPTPHEHLFWAKAPFLLRVEAEPRKAPSRATIERILRTAQIPFSGPLPSSRAASATRILASCIFILGKSRI